MKNTPIAPKVTRRLAAVSFAILFLGPAVVRAAECPESSPEDPQERRRLAKEWFSTAETAENAGDDAEATRAYACSYKMVAHPYTAFNLARVADRSGQTDLSLKMYKAYLALKPDAKDAEEVKVKIKALEEKMTAAIVGPSTEPAATPIPEETPAPEPPKDVLSPPPVPKPVDVVTRPKAPAPESEPSSHLVEWILGGAAVGTLAGGITTNLIARAKMDTCRTDAANELYAKANNECNSAKPLAYASYAFFSVAAAAAAADAALIILKYRAAGDSSSEEDSSYGFMMLPGGGGLSLRGRF
jgi:tetratricopeptide (TPR) repeat protein